MSEFLREIPKGIVTGEIEGSATAQQLSDIDCQLVMIQALIANTGNVYIGGAGVTVPDGTADATSGIGLTPGDFSPWIPVANLNQLYQIGASADDDISYICVL